MSGDWHTPGSTTTTTTHGYYVWNEVNVYLGGSYSNSGGPVSGHLISVRNRDLNQRDACYGYLGAEGWSLFVINHYSTVGWMNLGALGESSSQYQAC